MKDKEDAKYYTPNSKEFRIGFEYEIFEDFDYYEEKSWHKLTYGDVSTGEEHIGYPFPPTDGRIRVKCLDGKDINKLGWKTSTEKPQISTGILFTKGDYSIEMNINKFGVALHIRDEEVDFVHFSGFVKNISELEVLLIQIRS